MICPDILDKGRTQAPTNEALIRLNKIDWQKGKQMGLRAKKRLFYKNLAGLILVPVNGIKTRWAAVTVSPINNGASPEVV